MSRAISRLSTRPIEKEPAAWRGDVGRRLAEIWRVLKPGGLYQGTMLPTRNINYGSGRIVAPDTFVRDRAEEPGHPHFYCDAATLVALFAGFELLSLKQQRSASPVPGTGTSSPNAGRSRSA